MKRLMLAALVALLVLGFTGWARAEGLFKDDAGKKEGPAAKAVEPAGAEPAGEKNLLPAAVKKRMDDKIAMAEKMLQTYKAEMDKPEGKRDAKKADGFRIRACDFYRQAAFDAKAAAAQTKKEEQKAAITEQFEKPNKQKAIGILLELASTAAERKDIRSAVGFYREVLKLDPENISAKEGLQRLEAQVKNAPKDTKGTGSKGGGDNENGYDPSKARDGSRTGVDKHPGDWKNTNRTW